MKIESSFIKFIQEGSKGLLRLILRRKVHGPLSILTCKELLCLVRADQTSQLNQRGVCDTKHMPFSQDSWENYIILPHLSLLADEWLIDNWCCDQKNLWSYHNSCLG